MVTQKDRVRAALERHPQGITQVDFLLPDVIDGRQPITRVAARVEELRDDGHPISGAGTRDGCTIYRIQGGAAAAADSEFPHGPPRMRVSQVIGPFHVCDRCEFRWHSRRPPSYCPSCKASVLWLAAFFTELAASVYTPLTEPAEAKAA